MSYSGVDYAIVKFFETCCLSGKDKNEGFYAGPGRIAHICNYVARPELGFYEGDSILSDMLEHSNNGGWPKAISEQDFLALADSTKPKSWALVAYHCLDGKWKLQCDLLSSNVSKKASGYPRSISLRRVQGSCI
jgi:hypothetical protein